MRYADALNYVLPTFVWESPAALRQALNQKITLRKTTLQEDELNKVDLKKATYCGGIRATKRRI